MKKRLQPSAKGFILVECMVALAILTTTVFLFQISQVQILKETKKSQEELQMLRVLYEETKQRRHYQMKSADYQIIRDGTFTISYQTAPKAQAKISAGQQEWAIIREK
ncbi:hypothetical protein [Tetragenococcus solitarius]|uniref:Type II secretion system protein n=1 Tax=Tetragenococcus solitarius TaxID=71453 RepID=A0ABP6KN29_9ENTE|nr:hypothetical protein [Tetragenococcus solitarius]